MPKPQKEVQPSHKPEDYDRVCLLVGKYFMFWSLLETEIGNVIQLLFRLENRESYIILANIAFRDKLYILQTALGEARLTEDLTRLARKTIRRIRSRNKDRNNLAHNMFCPTTDGRTEIMRVEAKTKLGFPDEIWTDEDFDCRIKSIERATKDLRELKSKIKDRDAIVSALLAKPSDSTEETDFYNRLFRPHLSHPHSDQNIANPKIDSQKPQNRPENEDD